MPFEDPPLVEAMFPERGDICLCMRCARENGYFCERHENILGPSRELLTYYCTLCFEEAVRELLRDSYLIRQVIGHLSQEASFKICGWIAYQQKVKGLSSDVIMAMITVLSYYAYCDQMEQPTKRYSNESLWNSIIDVAELINEFGEVHLSKRSVA